MDVVGTIYVTINMLWMSLLLSFSNVVAFSVMGWVFYVYRGFLCLFACMDVFISIASRNMKKYINEDENRENRTII